MRKIIYILISCSFVPFFYAQSFKTNVELEKKIELINKFKFEKLDSAIYLSKQLQEESKNKYPVYYAKALRLEARTHLINGDFQAVSACLHKAIPIFIKYDVKTELAASYNAMSILFGNLKNSEKEVFYLFKAKEIYEDLNKRKGLGIINGNIANFYIKEKSPKKALKFIKIQEKFIDKNNGEEFFLFYNYAGYYALLSDFRNAFLYIDKAILVAEKYNMVDAFTTGYIAKGEYLIKLDDEKNAAKSLEKALFLAKSSNNLPEQKICLENMLLLKVNSKNLTNNLKINAELKIVKDSLLTIDKINFVQRLETKLRFKEKEDYISKQNIRLLKSKLNQKQLDQKIIIFIFIASAFLILIFFLVLIYFRMKKKNLIISLQKIEEEKQKIELKNLNELNKKIFAIISHDFKGPMNSLEILVNLMNENSDDNSFYLKLLPDVKNQLIQSNLVLENLINLAQSELNLSKIEIQNVFPHKIFGELILLYQNDIAMKNICVKNQLDPSLVFSVQEDLFKIVCRNIFSNALKFSFNSGEILLYNSDNKSISVEDFGVGINPKVKNELFNQNVQSFNGTNFETGYGLGLKISAEITEKMHGKLKLIEKKSEGSVFSLIFDQDN